MIVCAGKGFCGPMSSSTLQPILCGVDNISGPLILLMVFILLVPSVSQTFAGTLQCKYLSNTLIQEPAQKHPICLWCSCFQRALDIVWYTGHCPFVHYEGGITSLLATVCAGRVLSKSLILTFEPCRYSGIHHRLQTLDTLDSQGRNY